MFTGIIKNKGTVISVKRISQSFELSIKCETIKNVSVGDSIAIDGVCLTVTQIKGNVYNFDISFETIKKTAFDKCKSGQFVNLEQALKLSDGIDGHLVQGHVDTTGIIKKIIKRDNAHEIDISVESNFEQFLVPTGWIAVNGVSLTIANSNKNIFTLVIIPHSFKETNISLLNTGDIVNIEFDFIGKYLYYFRKFPNGGFKW